MNNQTDNSKKLYATAKSLLSTVIVPQGFKPELGCAISVTTVINKIGLTITNTASTFLLLDELINCGLFSEVTDPLAGDVIISATGTSAVPNNTISHGHCGILGNFGIMSNDSISGKWKEKWTLSEWQDYYEKQGGYPTRFFRLK